jgi:threonine aldolase
VDFRSDNVGGAHPAVLEAIVRANRGAADPYGADLWSQRLAARFNDLFEREVAVFPVATGTAANALSIAMFTPPWGAVYCHPNAHVNVSECGAPEQFSAGAKLIAVPGDSGKITGHGVERAIHREDAVHTVQPSLVSISQASEIGTLYTRSELESLSEACARHRMHLHVDGARFAHALVALGASPAELTWKAGVDVLAFGATKNGCLAAEAVVLFEPARAQELAYRRKRAGHLISKQRFVSAQLEAYLTDELWLSNARQANALAQRLGAALQSAGFALATPVETNQLFVTWPASVAANLRARGFAFYDWGALGPDVYRLVTAFDTRVEDVDALVTAARALRVQDATSPTKR